jgi:hypothetical protein
VATARFDADQVERTELAFHDAHPVG